MVTSNSICSSSGHFVDGMFLSTIFNFLALLMVYKLWDSRNAMDLEYLLPSEKMEKKEFTAASYYQ